MMNKGSTQVILVSNIIPAQHIIISRSSCRGSWICHSAKKCNLFLFGNKFLIKRIHVQWVSNMIDRVTGNTLIKRDADQSTGVQYLQNIFIIQINATGIEGALAEMS